MAKHFPIINKTTTISQKTPKAKHIFSPILSKIFILHPLFFIFSPPLNLKVRY